MHVLQTIGSHSASSTEARPLVLVVDDHRVCRETLATALCGPGSILRVRTAPVDSGLILRCLDAEDSAVVLLSCCSEVTRPLALLRAIRASNQKARVIVLTTSHGETFRSCAGYLGIDAMLTSASEVAAVVRAVAAAPVARALVADCWPRPLTPRETQIVRYVTAGLRNAQIARRIGIAEKTVKVHLTNVYGKLGVRGRDGLAALAPQLLADAKTAQPMRV